MWIDIESMIVQSSPQEIVTVCQRSPIGSCMERVISPHYCEIFDIFVSVRCLGKKIQVLMQLFYYSVALLQNLHLTIFENAFALHISCHYWDLLALLAHLNKILRDLITVD